jgi:bifunctional non-homologous end joining protein LigD
MNSSQAGITTTIRSVRSARGHKLLTYIKPMLANLHNKPFDDQDWIFEIKWDGYRAIAEVDKEIKLYSRNGLSFLQLYPQVAQALTKIKEKVILDGEIIVLNDQHKPDFQKLQQYGDHRSLKIMYYVFDCLSYKGKSIMSLPLIERKKIAQQVVPVESTIIQYSDHVRGSGIEFFNKAVQMDLEGVIAKRANSLYIPGKRTQDWLKIKNHNTQEAIIAGYTAPRGSRPYFGALILAIHDQNSLRYIGHTGTGLTEDLLKDVFKKLQPLKRKTSPFNKKIAVNGAVTWVEPVVVCNIKFTEITADGILRHPVFMGIRIDKTSEEVTSLEAQSKPKASSKKEMMPHETSHKTGLTSSAEKRKLKVEGHEVTLTHESKIYWPSEKITKGDVLEYYHSIHQYILPYLKDRPQSLKRNPDGIKNKGFFHKDAGSNAPPWVDHIKILAESTGKEVDYILCNNEATLLYLSNLGCIEFNPWNSRTAKLDYPDYMVLDIDPSETNSFDEVIESALAVKSVLDKAGAASYCKTSGATGVHIYVPMKALYTYDQARSFGEIIAMLTNEQLPKTTTLERSLEKRSGKIYLDYLQNKRGQTLASVYSVRPQPAATISTPLLWKEVKSGLHPSQFTLRNFPARLKKEGDLFSGVLKEKIDLKKCLKNLGS